MTNNLEKKVVESPDNLDSLSNDYCVKSSNISYFGKLKQGFNSLKKNIRKKALPLVLGTALLCGGVSCDLSNPSNPYNPPETPDKKDKVVILMNTAPNPNTLLNPTLNDEVTYNQGYASLNATKVTLIDCANYNSEDIYILGHDPTNLQFENYRQLTRENLTNLMQEINENYSDDAFLIINSIGHSGLEDTNNDSTPDCISTEFCDGLYYSSEYPNLIYTFLKNDRKVIFSVNKCYSGYVIDAFENNPKDNILVYTSSKKDEETKGRILLDHLTSAFNEKYNQSYDLNGDNILSGQEVFQHIDSIAGESTSERPAYSFGTPQMWSKDTTDPNDFVITKL